MPLLKEYIDIVREGLKNNTASYFSDFFRLFFQIVFKGTKKLLLRAIEVNTEQPKLPKIRRKKQHEKLFLGP